MIWNSYDRINDEADIKVTICDSRTARLTLATSGPDVALFCSDCEEADVLATSRRLRPETPMMVIGESRDVDRVVDYIRNGACDFIQKPCSPAAWSTASVRRSPCGQRDRDRVLQPGAVEGHLPEAESFEAGDLSRLDELQQNLESNRDAADRQTTLPARASSALSSARSSGSRMSSGPPSSSFSPSRSRPTSRHSWPIRTRIFRSGRT